MLTTNNDVTHISRKRPRCSSERGGKGLRHFSSKVCEKVKSKGVTTYLEVSEELVEEFSQQSASVVMSTPGSAINPINPINPINSINSINPISSINPINMRESMNVRDSTIVRDNINVSDIVSLFDFLFVLVLLSFLSFLFFCVPN